MSLRKPLCSILAAGILYCLAASPAAAQEFQDTSLVLVGAEDLPGYGLLTFRLLPGFRAEMTDKDGTAFGKWMLQGNQVFLSFHNDTVLYRGMVQGNRV